MPRGDRCIGDGFRQYWYFNFFTHCFPSMNFA
jgi:hypothetical protein